MSVAEQRVGAWLEQLASRAPAPGGGSAAALAGAQAAALVAMVARLTLPAEAAESRQAGQAAAGAADAPAEAAGALADAERLRAALVRAADEDARAFEAVMAAYRLPRSTDEERARRREAVQAALHMATAVPLRTAAAAVEVLETARRLAPVANPHAASDLGVAAHLAAAAAEGALLNVAINLKGLRDGEEVDRLRREAAEVRRRAQALREAVVRVVEASLA
ncbi:MAG: cyclodeaminase/cyclohydrolase family protein [Armatimonadota bacterium]|nr:cyclodeaminase/cyclohydrolase family protein [Armatimonadota bacterium]MDR7449043.1 cyclodeaminase/cyclohydrolase family protein [Armatimonadota bacterium]MDR7459449.1 cyclodeaminase/cyclohydrolase family protein [Armatimonadota bacterium]MDR7480186.1 cyclodeaminase/cyclohydrolase family protein [Armatimonadota bacterium]MDR7488538.1 cyclodeaminase/cyclohydrolase family protein [Armatimonadota bacterium]